MTDVYAFERCPLRDATHAVADRHSIVRHALAAVWPAARRAERVELSEEGITAWSLEGRTFLAWDDIATARSGRTLRIVGAAGRIDVARVLPGYDEIERRILARGAVAAR